MGSEYSKRYRWATRFIVLEGATASFDSVLGEHPDAPCVRQVCNNLDTHECLKIRFLLLYKGKHPCRDIRFPSSAVNEVQGSEIGGEVYWEHWAALNDILPHRNDALTG